MADNGYRALVVDDEPAVRNLAIRALQYEGFSCDAAADGDEAERMIPRHRYDVVVTDLRMPNKNGHVLASNILLMKNRPVVVILTGVLEPKIVKDMTTRGVDCIEFKPVDYLLFAAKVRGLVDGKKLQAGADRGESPSPYPFAEMSRPYADGVKIERTIVSKHDIESKLMQLTRILPISGIAFEIFNMTSAETYDNHNIAAVVGLDATLSVDILRLANSSFYNYSRRKIVNLVKAIGRIGQKRVGELALATSMMVALTPSVLPWMDLSLTWHRSMAAAVAIDYLAERKGVPQKDNRLFLSSITYPLGRIALCMLYPNRYQEMIRICHESQISLKELEKQYFSLSPEEVMGFLLKAWNIPDFLFDPLVCSAHSYNSMTSLGDPLATKVELLKIAILIAEISVGRWEAWDRIELPPVTLLDRIGIDSYEQYINKTKGNYKDLLSFRESIFQQDETYHAAAPEGPPSPVFYRNLSPSFDFLGEIVARAGFELRECALDELGPEEPVIVNCLGVPAHKLVSNIRSTESNPRRLILTDSPQTDNFSRFGRVLAFPTSYSALRKACRDITE